MAAPRTLPHPFAVSFFAPVALAAALLLPAIVGRAQTPAAPPSPWAELLIPNGTSTPQASSLGKLAVYRDGSTLSVYSAVTRRWHATTASSNAALWQSNDCLLIMDGGAWTAFAATRSVFEPLSVSAQALLLNPPSQNNDAIVLVQDGAQLHSFSGFVGSWSTRQVGAGAAWAVKRNVALLVDGNVMSGMDAFSGQWHDQPFVGGAVTLDADGAAGIVLAGAFAHGFSAAHTNWQTAMLPSNATFARDDDWALLYSTTEMLAYSGPQARFEWAPLGAVAVRASEDHFGVVETVAGLVPFSAVCGSFGPPLGSSSANLTTSTSVALCSEGGTTRGYSAVRNTVASIANMAVQDLAAGIIAVSQPGNGGGWHVYSALDNRWHDTPPDVLTSGTPLLTTTSAVFDATAGLRAFGPASGNFFLLPGTNLRTVGNPSSAIAAAWDNTHLHAFDTRLERWCSSARPTNATTPMFLIWRTTLLATDGTSAFGFGAQSGQWSSTPLPEAFATGRSNSESGLLLTSTRALGYSALPEVSGWPQFPAFRRVLTTGCTARMSLPLGPGDLALLAFGWPGPSTAIAGLGELLLEPSTMVTQLLLPAANAGVLQFAVDIPPTPWAVGLTLGMQPLLLRTGSQPYLGELSVLHIW